MNYQDARLDFVPLDAIAYNPAINARRDTVTDVTELAATIDTSNIGQPLLLRPGAGGSSFEPVDGGRRFRALKLLAEQGHIASDFPVPAMIRDLSDADALTLSLQTAVTRLDLNPADEALSFADLVKAGKTPDEIAATFGVPLRRVKQRLAIAALPEPIVSALRSGEIGVETAQAFTVGTDPIQVLKLFEQADHSHPQYIRNQLMQKRVSMDSREARFVSAESYRAAGGHIDEDLFSNNAWAADGKLLQKLFDQKVKAEEKRLLAEGWAWFMIEPETYGKTNGWPTLPPEGKTNLSKDQKTRADELRAELRRLRRAHNDTDDEDEVGRLTDAIDVADAELEDLTGKQHTDAQKKKCGVILQYCHNRIELRLGVMKPAEAKNQAKASKQKARDTSNDPSPVRQVEPDAEADFTGALQAEMAKAMTHAMQTAISTKHGLGLRAACAALLVVAGDRSGAQPFEVSTQSRFLSIGDDVKEKLEIIVASFSDGEGMKDVAEILRLLTTVDAETVNATIALSIASVLNLHETIRDDHRPLIDLFDPDVTAAWQPNEEFFKRMPRESLAAALKESAVPDVTPSKKKKELVEMAIRHLQPMGWLPKPLRTPCYKGPGSNVWADARAAQLADEATAQQQAAE